MNGYDFYADYIRKGRNGIDRPLANNTRVHLKGLDAVGIRLHDTDVLTFHKNGDVEFNTGGWFTVTTKDRMDYARDYMVFSDRGTWYICNRKARANAESRLRRKFGLPVTEADWPRENPWESEYLGNVSLGYCRSREARYGDSGFWGELVETIGRKDAYRIYRAFNDELRYTAMYLFHDGIRFTKRGRCLNAIPVAEARAKVKADDRMRERISEFAKLAVAKLDEGMPVQNNGDCWYCLMRVTDEPDYHDRHGFSTGSLRGRPLGDAQGNHEHLREHLREGYVPSALILNAMDEQPYTDVGKQMHLGLYERRYDDDSLERALYMGGLVGYDTGARRRCTPDIVAKAVYEYIARRLMPGREVRGVFNRSSFPLPEHAGKTAS